jgi:hypothetical protein
VSDDGKRRVAETLRELRDAERDRELAPRAPGQVLGAAKPVQLADHPEGETPPAPPPELQQPDNRAVNERWDLRRLPLHSGWRGWLMRALRPVLSPLIEAQVEFNSRQVQLDNQLLAYLSDRFDATHRQYDSVLGLHGRRMNDIDQRHLELQEEVVSHVHDLVQRIDLVLGEGERSRVALEAALRDVRRRLTALEDASRKG